MSERSRLGRYFRNRQEKGATGLPMLAVTMNDGLVPRDDLERRMETNLSPEEHLRVRPGDIAYNMMRMWQGACGLSHIDALVSPAYVVLQPLDDVDPRFALHWFKSARLSYLLWAYSHGITDDRLRLYFDDFAQVPAEPPSLPVQVKIAEILDTWDKVLSVVDRSIAAQRLRKRGLSAMLLRDCLDLSSPKKGRKMTKLGAAFAERREKGRVDRLLSISGSLGVVDRDELDRRDTSSEDKSSYKRIAPGDIGYNTMRMWQGVSALSALEGIVSPAYTIVRPRDGVIRGDFAAQLFRLPQMIHRFWSYSQGLVDDTLSLKFPSFAAIGVSLPPLADQASIAAILDTADVELRALETMRNRLLVQKRGLMQLLLPSEWLSPQSPWSIQGSSASAVEAAE